MSQSNLPKPSVLYISYTGMLDSLGESQVLQYLLGLSGQYSVTLLSFEKPDQLQQTARLEKLQQCCVDAGIDWVRLPFHVGPGPLGKFKDLLRGALLGLRLARQSKASIVHCRSYMASLMGLYVCRRSGAKHIFDMRGFWPDERVEGRTWAPGSLHYRLFKRAEKTLFLRTDYVVSLTHLGEATFRQFDYLQGRPLRVSVIPTCTNMDLFSLRSREQGAPFTLGYVGSVGSWYRFDRVARAVALLFRQDPTARFLVINKGGHEQVRDLLQAEQVDLSRVEIRSANFDEVGEQVGRMDAGLFFIKPLMSKRASCPTRMGEFLAAGKPCLANAGVGDVEPVLTGTNTGIALASMDDNSLAEGLDKLRSLAEEDDIAGRCRAAADQHFALEKGVGAYGSIYEQLLYKY